MPVRGGRCGAGGRAAVSRWLACLLLLVAGCATSAPPLPATTPPCPDGTVTVMEIRNHEVWRQWCVYGWWA